MFFRVKGSRLRVNGLNPYPCTLHPEPHRTSCDGTVTFMAKNKNDAVAKALGLALIVIGVGLAWWGYQISESLTVQVTTRLTGGLPDEVMYRYIGGAACGLAGLFLAVKG